jgi:hypothetical protein
MALNKTIPIICILLLLVAGCNEITLHSGKLMSPVIMDGKIQEWNVNDFTSADDNRIKLGYFKDSEYLYIAGITTNKELIRQAFNGFSIWIDPSGEENKDLVMELKLPQTKRIEYYKGGFFAALTDKQKKIVFQAIDSLKQGVVVTDKKNNNSINFPEGMNDKFAGKIFSAHDTLSFEIKIPIAVNKVFDSYQPVTKNSIIGISASAGFSGFQNRPAPHSTYTMSGETRRDSTFRRNDETVDKPEDFEIWLKLEE